MLKKKNNLTGQAALSYLINHDLIPNSKTKTTISKIVIYATSG